MLLLQLRSLPFFALMYICKERGEEEELGTVCHGPTGLPLGFTLYVCLNKLKRRYVWVNKRILTFLCRNERHATSMVRFYQCHMW